MVHTLDRLGRTVRDTLNMIHELTGRGVGVRNLADPIRVDSSRPEDPTAQLAVVLLALFGQMERTYTLERAAHARAVATVKPGPRAAPAATGHLPHPQARPAAAARGAARPPGPRAARLRPVHRGAWGWAAAHPGHGQPDWPCRRARRPPDPARGHLGRAWRLRFGGTVRHRTCQQWRCPGRRRCASPATTTSPATSSALKTQIVERQ